MFPEIFAKDVVLQAVDKLYARREMHGYASWFVQECVTEISKVYPELAAAALERAGDHLFRRAGNSGAISSQLMIEQAAKYWLLSGNAEESSEALYHEISIGLKATSQRDLFGRENDAGLLEPLLRVGAQHCFEGRYTEAIAAYQLASNEFEIAGEYELALESSLRQLRIYALLKNWSEAQDRAYDCLGFAEIGEIDYNDFECSEVIYYLTKSMLILGNIHDHDLVVENLEMLIEELKDGPIAEIDQNEVVRMLAYARLLRGEKRFHQWVHRDKPELLLSAEDDLLQAVAVWEEIAIRPRKLLSRAYANLSTYYSAMGDTDKAKEYRDQAMRFGFDLSDD